MRGTSSTVVMHFPDGSREFRLPTQLPDVGDFVWRDGHRYRVARVDADQAGAPVVTLDGEFDVLGHRIPDPDAT